MYYINKKVCWVVITLVEIFESFKTYNNSTKYNVRKINLTLMAAIGKLPFEF